MGNIVTFADQVGGASVVEPRDIQADEREVYAVGVAERSNQIVADHGPQKIADLSAVANIPPDGVLHMGRDFGVST
jgi:hypothetical protein